MVAAMINPAQPTRGKCHVTVSVQLAGLRENMTIDVVVPDADGIQEAAIARAKDGLPVNLDNPNPPPRRSSTAERSHDRVHRRSSGSIWDRADLQGVADRPVDYHAHVAQRIDASKRSARAAGCRHEGGGEVVATLEWVDWFNNQLRFSGNARVARESKGSRAYVTSSAARLTRFSCHANARRGGLSDGHQCALGLFPSRSSFCIGRG
jgi:hypothetical protein